MSFQMVHMEIAYRVAEMTGIKERAAFILGSVLPDSVHMRDDYSRTFLKDAVPGVHLMTTTGGSIIYVSSEKSMR